MPLENIISYFFNKLASYIASVALLEHWAVHDLYKNKLNLWYTSLYSFSSV